MPQESFCQGCGVTLGLELDCVRWALRSLLCGDRRVGRGQAGTWPLAPHPLGTCPSSHWSTRADTSSSNIFTRAGSSGASAAMSRSLGFPQK